MSDERLLAGPRDGGALDRAGHLAVHGELGPGAHDPQAVLALAEASGLRGRGGAGFPLGRKLRAVAAGRGPKVVVANGAEGEPASLKDRLLLSSRPHLVLDGVVLAAAAVGAREAFLCISDAMPEAAGAVGAALALRSDPLPMRVVGVADTYVAGEESALVHALNRGAPVPTAVPPRPFEVGFRRRPTLVSNVETLAHLALVARRGAGWFRERGTADDPGTALLTVSGAVARRGVREVGLGATLAEVIEQARPTTPARAFLVGGYFGAWVGAEEAPSLPLAHQALRGLGGSLGCGVVVALPDGTCGMCVTARVMDYLARQSAGQCGPCRNGLRALADALAALVAGRSGAEAHARLERWADDVEGRGACHHPDGAVRLLRSALRVFAEELEDHVRTGRCPEDRRAAA